LRDAARLVKGSVPGVILIDLDGFKTFNDTRGHEAGNDCLAEVVAIVERVLGNAGRLYRYGGDEFSVLIKRADTEVVATIAESIRTAIETGKPGGGDPRVTASIGVACQEKTSARNASSLANEADEAVYVSKLVRGKNSVTVAPISEEDRVLAQGKREAERFAAANRGLLLRVHEKSEALRQICVHTDRLYQVWIQAAFADAAHDAIRARVPATATDDPVQSELDFTLAVKKALLADERARSGGKYDGTNPVYHARWYVQDAVQKFLRGHEFSALSGRIELFQELGRPRSAELLALMKACDCLNTEADDLGFAWRSESAGPNPSLSSFLDSLIRVEEFASTVSGMTATLLPDLRSVPAVMQTK
jgi:diguanylate cyclase (GGDEF)-like protein